MRRIETLALIGLAVTLAAAAPSRTSRWWIATPDDYQKGTLENLVLTSTGELTLGPALQRTDSGELSVWCSAAGPRGEIYFGTGTEGKLYSLSAQKEWKEIGKTGELVISSLVWAPDGRLYAATIPNGKIFTYDPAGGKLSELVALPDPYVWSIAAWSDDHTMTLVAGTGPNGKIYKISPAGKAELWFESKQAHVLSLAAASGTFYAGTSPSGVLFRIPADGKGEVVFNTEEQEIRALVWANDALYIGANKSKKFDPKKFVKRLQAAAAQAQEGEEKESPFQDLFDGSVYRLSGNQPARLLQSFQKSYLAGLAVDKTGSIYVGTGDEGQVWRIDGSGTRALFAKLKESQAMTLPVVGGELAAIGTGNAGAVYAVTPGGARAGSFTSEILDAKFPATWGTISWDATGPLSVQTRSGKTARPDDGTWSDWSAPISSGPVKIQSPPGRYFQLRVSWKDGSTAALRWLNAFYKTENQQPDIKEIELDTFDENTAFLGKIRESAEVGIRWKGADPDGDDLVYRVYVQREGREDWVPLTPEPTAKKDYKWDTREAADGWYRVKVVASDEGVNASESALSAIKVTRPVLIDNRKPTFEGTGYASRAFTGSVADTSSVIARIEYSLNAGPWQFLLPEDGLYDERTERFTIRFGRDVAAGNHHLSVRALDSGGNVVALQESLRIE